MGKKFWFTEEEYRKYQNGFEVEGKFTSDNEHNVPLTVPERDIIGEYMDETALIKKKVD